MAIFYSSDHHWGHHNVILFDERPFKDVCHMNNTMIDNWNSVVNPEDTVYYLGDFCMNPKYLYLTKYLNGKLILCPGNHEKHYWNYPKLVEKYLREGFVEVLPKVSKHLLSNGTEVILSHIPYDNSDPRYVNVKPKDEGLWILHGHVHVKWKVKGRQINVGVPVWDYTPVSEDTILGIINGT